MSARSRRRTWTYGGAGLIVCGAVRMLQTGLSGPGAADVTALLAAAVFAASVLLLAVGLSRDASLVRRSPAGVTAMVVVAVWPLTAFALTRSPVLGPEVSASAWNIYGYVALFVPAAAGLIAAATIARSGVVPSPWRWAPMWVLGAHAVAWAVPQLVFATVRPESIQSSADLIMALGALATVAGTFGLGVLAIVLAVQQRADAVEVFRSA